MDTPQPVLLEPVDPVPVACAPVVPSATPVVPSTVPVVESAPLSVPAGSTHRSDRHDRPGSQPPPSVHGHASVPGAQPSSTQKSEAQIKPSSQAPLGVHAHISVPTGQVSATHRSRFVLQMNGWLHSPPVVQGHPSLPTEHCPPVSAVSPGSVVMMQPMVVGHIGATMAKNTKDKEALIEVFMLYRGYHEIEPAMRRTVRRGTRSIAVASALR